MAGLFLLSALSLAAPFAYADEETTDSTVENKLAYVYMNYPKGYFWNETELNTECYGFARRVIFEIFNVTEKGEKYRSWNSLSIGGLVGMRYVGTIPKKTMKNKTEGPEALYELLKQAKPGDVIQCTGGSRCLHSMIVYSVEVNPKNLAKSKLTIYDCNWYSYKGKAYHNMIRLETGYTFSSFYNHVDQRGDFCLLRSTNHKKVDGETYIRLNAVAKQIALGLTVTLTATVSPKSALGDGVIWESNNRDVATVDDNGRVRAKQIGKATITARTADGVEATCEVEVVDAIPAPASVKATVGSGQITVKWSKVDGYKNHSLQRRENGGEWKSIKLSDNTVTKYVDKDVKAGVDYEYRVKAGKGYTYKITAGTGKATVWGAYAYSSAVYIPVSAPKKVTTTVGKTSITVSWSSSTGATQYALYRKEGSNPWTRIDGELTGKSYTDETVEFGKTYQYAVKAYWRDWSGATKSSKTLMIPAAPASITLSAKKGSVTVKWAKSTSATKYALYRKEGDGSWKCLSSKLTKNSYTDKSVKAGKTYQYRVKAYNASGWSTYTYSDQIVGK